MSQIGDKPRRDVLPVSCPPRGLSLPQAAEYIGVSTSTFAKLVADGQMPPAKQIRGRKVWDRIRLDEWFAEFDDEGANPWDNAV